MGWVREKLQDQELSGKPDRAAAATEESFQQKASACWAQLLDGFKQDVEEFRRITGKAEFDQRKDAQCRISNPQARIAVVVTADLPQHAIRYSYEPQSEDAATAVPEEGILTLRSSGSPVELFSADQPMTAEAARKLVLEPLLFPPAGKKESPAA